MKKVMLAGVAAIAMTSSGALAADVTMPMKAPPPAAYDWGGFYVGGHLGWMDGNLSTDFFANGTGASGYAAPPGAHNGLTDNGFAGGFQGGYNWVVFPNWLLGVEVDGTGSTLSDSYSDCNVTGQRCNAHTGRQSAFVSARARAGFIWDNLLFYGNAGYAAVDHRDHSVVTCINATPGACPGAGPDTHGLTGSGAEAQAWSNGLVFGGGLEWGFAQRWTARLEYERYQFRYTGGYAFGPCLTACNGPLVAFTALPTLYKTTASFDSVMFGINYLFWPGL